MIATAINGCSNGGTKGAARLLRRLAAGTVLHPQAGAGLQHAARGIADLPGVLLMRHPGAASVLIGVIK